MQDAGILDPCDNAHAVSPKGAMGLTQIMSETVPNLRARYDLGANPNGKFSTPPRICPSCTTATVRPVFFAYNAGSARYGIIWRAVDHFLPRRAPTLSRSHRRSPRSRLTMR